MDETTEVDVFEDNGVLMLRYPDGGVESYDNYLRRTEPGMSYDNATGELIVATPPSAEAAMLPGAGPKPDTFGDTTTYMASPYFENAAELAANAGRRPTYFENPLMQGLERTGQYIGDMTLAGLNAGLGTVYGGAGLLGEAIGGDTQDERRLARDLAGMFDAAGPAPEGRMLGLLMDAGAPRAVAADVVERLSQRGPMPTAYSNPIPGLLGDTAAYAPEQTQKAYKLFRVDKNRPGELFPLFVNANDPVGIGKWLRATAGDLTDKGQVKSKIGPLAYRPGWHAGDSPMATHIGAKSSAGLTAPDIRPPNQVWAEVDFAADKDWQSAANAVAQRNKRGEVIPRTAHITDQVPYGGFYRYKTNPNMTGDWLIGGDMRVNRVLTDDEVRALNEARGVSDLPRAEPSLWDLLGWGAQ